MNPLNQESQRPWYKEPMVWLMLGLPMVSIVMVLTFVTIAVKHGDSVVRDNYYKDGLAINQELALDDKAAELAAVMTLDFDRESGLVKGSLISKLEKPSFLQLALIHPTLKEQDQEVLLQLIDDKYQGQVKPYIDGSFHLHLTSPTQKWRIREQVKLFETANVQLNGVQ